MKITKENLSDIREEYEKAHRYIDEESKNDPPTEPFRSHYIARDVLNSALRKVKILSEALDPESEVATTVRCLQASILKDIAKITIFVEEPRGEVLLQEALELIEKDYDKEPAINVRIEILNQLGIMACNQSNFVESKQYLDQAKDVYFETKELEREPLTMTDMFGTKEEVEKGKGMKLLESNHTLTLYYLAQVFGFLDNLADSAQYCHMTLQRQLEYNEYEHVDWALNAVTLSQFYFPKNHLTQARHLLAASTFMLNRYETEVVEKVENATERAEKEEILRYRMADVGRCWAKYGLHILATLKERLSADDEPNEDGTREPPLTPVKKVTRFTGLDLAAYEGQVTDEFCLTFDDAKLVMLNSLSWLNKAKEYYTKETEASQYAKILQDVASLYKHLAFFEEDDSNQCKLYKRGADQLEEIVEILNATYYQTICREAWYELGLTYSNMLNVKLGQLDEVQAKDRPTPHALNKINHLCEKSIRNFKKFIESYKIDLETLDLPDSIGEDEMQPILYAYFHIGRLYYRTITPDKRLKLKNTENSLFYYNRFVACCQDERMRPLFVQELGVCREIITLLPLKIEKLKSEIAEG
ncbi:KIF-binding protein [Anopheles maculipalpis]|uniref:KIF-binding protein n=1 Tax=Anopheles maculipalpis TaxID=1496333 RepID=UPI0021599B46|nr:KIF-binding protein [Anopheles maculipalpis]